MSLLCIQTLLAQEWRHASHTRKRKRTLPAAALPSVLPPGEVSPGLGASWQR